MSNAAIWYHPDAFDVAGPRLLGRQSAGESFLRGFLRHADVDQFYFANWVDVPNAEVETQLRQIEPITKPVAWIGRSELSRIAEPGCLFIPSPDTPREAWNRRLVGPTQYSICGLTHTTADTGVMDKIVGMLLSPLKPWDALICTSRAVAESVALQHSLAMDFLREQFGSISEPQIRLETIPLGVNVDDFARSELHRAHWRAQLGIEDDHIAVLYVGRFSPHAKMNPVPMALALEKAAQRTKRPIHWIMSGWAPNPQLEDAFVGAGRRFAPTVKTHVLDGRLPGVRFPIWSAGDIFLSLSDNIQETFGLTPVEAMAAGLPSVISDWDGYRDLVEDGVQGFRVPTLAPGAGFGVDIAVGHANAWGTYEYYVGAASQFVAVDIDASVDALVQLIENDDLRRRMGAAAQERARTVFDWKTVIGQYQALWSELGAIRKAAPPGRPGGLNPWRPDPFKLFGSYPTRTLAPTDRVTLNPGATIAAVQATLREITVSYAAALLLSGDEIATIVGGLQSGASVTVGAAVAILPVARHGEALRCLLWMAKFGWVTISPRPQVRNG